MKQNISMKANHMALATQSPWKCHSCFGQQTSIDPGRWRKHQLPECSAIPSRCSWLTVHLAVNAAQRGNPALNAHRCRPLVADSLALCRRLSLLWRMYLQLPVILYDCACCCSVVPDARVPSPADTWNSELQARFLLAIVATASIAGCCHVRCPSRGPHSWTFAAAKIRRSFSWLLAAVLQRKQLWVLWCISLCSLQLSAGHHRWSVLSGHPCRKQVAVRVDLCAINQLSPWWTFRAQNTVASRLLRRFVFAS